MRRFDIKANTYRLGSAWARHKAWLCFALFIVAVSAFTGLISAIKFYNGVLPVSFSNVAFLNYLKGSTNFAMMLASNLLSTALFVGVVFVTFGSVWCRPLGVVFLMYYIYARIITIVSLLLCYGFINSLILFLCLLAFSVAYIALFCWLTVNSLDICAQSGRYFRECMHRSYCTVNIFALFAFCVLAEAITMCVLKNFLIILVY